MSTTQIPTLDKFDAMEKLAEASVSYCEALRGRSRDLDRLYKEHRRWRCYVDLYVAAVENDPTIGDPDSRLVSASQ